VQIDRSIFVASVDVIRAANGRGLTRVGLTGTGYRITFRSFPQRFAPWAASGTLSHAILPYANRKPSFGELH
jgi:hypothetical protein